MADIAKYKFNNGSEVLPIFEENYEYDYTDEVNSDGTVTRIITADSSPNSISFSEMEGLVSVEMIDTTNITNLSGLFQDCINLTAVDFNGMNTANVVGMSYMFSGCSGLINLDLTGIKTGNVLNMDSMFNGCSGLFSLDLNLINVSKVTSMNAMFQGCANISSFDLSSWNMASVINMGYLFEGCTNTLSISFKGLDIPDNAMMNNIFDNCIVLGAVIMDNCNVADINKVIGVMPMRSANDADGKLKVNLQDLSGINREALEAKYWNLASYEIILRYKFEKVPTSMWVYNYTGGEQSFTAPYPATFQLRRSSGPWYPVPYPS
jgi:surface protein